MSDAAHQPPADEGSSLGDAASHFTTEPGGTPAGPGRYVNVDELTPVEFLPGLGFRPVLGQKAMTNFVSFEPGAIAPRHVHEEEQIVVVLEGEFTFDLDGDVRIDAQGRRRRRSVLGSARRLDHRHPLPGDRRVRAAAQQPAQAGRGAGSRDARRVPRAAERRGHRGG